jgi:tetratricopeptide (TPR) repeat protein
MNDSHREEIAKLEALYASNPEGRVFTHLAEACRKAGQLERARSILDSGLERHPDYASAHVVLGRVLADAGDPAAAAHEFRRVLELDRHNLVALRSLGDLAAAGGNAEEALYYYGELAILDPSDMVIQDEIRRFRERVDQTQRFQGPPAVWTQEPAGEPVSATTPESEPAAASEPSTEPESEPESWTDASRPAAEGDAIEIEHTSHAGDVGATGTGEPGEALTEEQQAERGLELDEPAAVSLDGLQVPESTDWPDADRTPDEEVSFAGIVVEGMDFEPESGTGPESGSDEAVTSEAEPATSEAEAETSGEAGDRAKAEEAGSGDETGEGSGEWHGAEGRWEPPATIAADDDAERERETRADTGEWIPTDRWQWVAASAGAKLPAAESEVDESTEPEAEPEPAYEAPPAWLDAEAPEPAVAEADEADAAKAAAGDDESELSLDAAFAEPLARPVDSFEEGAADVLAAAGLLGGDEAGADAVQEAAEDVEYAADDVEPAEEKVEYAGDDVEYAAAETDTMDSAQPAGSEAGDWYDDDGDDSSDLVITETLAEIYASQGLMDRAVSVYRRLVREHPADDRLQIRLSQLETALEPVSGKEEPEAVEAGYDEGFEAAVEVGSEAEAGDFDEEIIEFETGVEMEFESADDGEEASGEEREAWLARVESAFTGGQGAAGAEDSPYAWASQDRPEDVEGGRIGDYFRTLLAWRPVNVEPIQELPAIEDTQPGETGSAYRDWTGSGSASEEPARSGESDEDLEMFRSWLKSLKK